MNIGILPNVNSTKIESCKAGDSVCSRIMRLMNNQTESRRKATIRTKESDDKNAVAIVKNCTTIGLRIARLGCVGFSKRQTVRGNPVQKGLGSIRKVRFSQSTLRQASIREMKGPSLGKIQVKHPHQRSPYAMKFEDWSHEETERQQRCARSKAWNFAS